MTFNITTSTLYLTDSKYSCHCSRTQWNSHYSIGNKTLGYLTCNIFLAFSRIMSNIDSFVWRVNVLWEIAVRAGVSHGVVEAPYPDYSVVCSMKRCSTTRLGFNTHPSGSAAVLINSIETILSDHDNRISALRLSEHWVQIWNWILMLVSFISLNIKHVQKSFYLHYLPLTFNMSRKWCTIYKGFYEILFLSTEIWNSLILREV